MKKKTCTKTRFHCQVIKPEKTVSMVTVWYFFHTKNINQIITIIKPYIKFM